MSNARAKIQEMFRQKRKNKLKEQLQKKGGIVTRKKVSRRSDQPSSSEEREKPGWFVDPVGSVSKGFRPLGKIVRRKRASKVVRRSQSGLSRGRMVKTMTRKAIR
tara:strand:+ start:125612 stop:125926 length:315 start_codon:yes stop_codon:yes gene_type:complete